MFVISIFFGRSGTTLRQWRNAFFSGIMLFVLGNGFLVWALQYMDSGVTALLVSFEPLVVVFLLWKIQGQIPRWMTLFGITLGVIGMGLLVGQPQYLEDSNWMFALGMVFISIFAWAYISVWLPNADLPANNFLSASMQMLCGGAGLFLLALFTGEFQEFHFAEVNARAIWSFFYLVFGGSIIAFTAFNYLLHTVSPVKVVTNAYVNPVVALLVGSLFNQEIISKQSLIASILLITGVIVINTRKRRPRKIN